MRERDFALRHLYCWTGFVFTLVASFSLVPVPGAEEGITDGPAGSRTEISDVPWDPNALAGNDKVIYGTDDRLDVYQETNPDRLAWAASVCALVDADDLTDNGDGTYTLATSAYQQGEILPCTGEAFANQPTASWCTGFVVNGDMIATAGHCVKASDLPFVRFVFGFEMVDATTPVLTFDADQVYTGTEIIARELTSEYDYAVVRTERPITSGVPLPLRNTGAIAVGTQVGVIGHPSGLPKKIAFGENTQVRKNDRPGFFYANLDTYGGNSGSPVFNAADGVVEGILVRGNEDFIIEGGCFRSDVLPNGHLESEEVTRSTTFADFVDQASGADACEGATAVALDETKTGSTDGSDGSDVSTCADGDSKDVWFAFTPPLDRYYEISLAGSAFNTTLTVYRGDCASLVEAGCNDDSVGQQSELCLHLDASIPHLIRIAGAGGETGFYRLNIAQSGSCGMVEGEGESGFIPPGVTITQCTVAPNPVPPGQPVTLGGIEGTSKSGTAGDTVTVTVGLRNGQGAWTGGDPVVVESGNPGTTGSSWNGDATIAAPSTVGTYYVWVRSTVTADAVVAIQDFQDAVPVSGDEERNDKWNTQVLVRLPSTEGEPSEGEGQVEGESEGEGELVFEGETTEGEPEEGEVEPVCCCPTGAGKDLLTPGGLKRWLGDILLFGAALMALAFLGSARRRF